MSDLDTEITGEVGNVRAVAQWLRGDLVGGFDDLGSQVATQRTAAAGDWQGEASTAFSGRAQTLVEASDDGAATTGAVATLVDDLAEDMRGAKDSMADVRSTARAGGLSVDGFLVRNPGQGPPSAGMSPAPDATPAEWSAWERADRAVRDHNAKVETWNACVEQADAAWQTWLDALEAAGGAWREHDSSYVGLTANLLSAGVQLELIRRTTPVLVGDVDDMLVRAQQLRDHADALRTPDGHITDPPRFYELLEDADRLDDAHPARRGALSNWELPRGLTRGLWVLDIAAAGYGIHSDWEEEGAAQAITSNAVPAIASIAAGAYVGMQAGAVVGSFIPIPGVGTAAGVVVGGLIGVGVGAFTSGAIDSLFDSGADTLGDWGGAVADGFEEVGDTIGGVVDGVGDVFDSIF
jgi:hypothetical protein